MRPPVLIVGAHRSGTTATARALEILGLQLGQCLDSHREPKGLQQLHEHYLEQLGAAWHNPAPFLESLKTSDGERNCVEYLRANTEEKLPSILGYGNNPRGLWLRARRNFGAVWGWKEPRTTLFAPAWLKIFPDARIVHIIRHPMAAAISIREREMKFRAAGDAPIAKIDNLDYGMDLVRRYTEAGHSLAQRTPHYQRVRFENMQADASSVLKELAHFCGLRSSASQLRKAAATIRPTKTRSTSS